jgi:uncharacterized protein (DUF1786 family)
MPSPTATVAKRIRAATAARRTVVLTGANAGGGPSSWALSDHLTAGLPTFATRKAAETINDDLDAVTEIGVTLISEEEAAKIDGDQIELRDIDLDAVRTALQAFGAEPHFDGVAIGVLDHGAAPPDVSDRLFRFQHLERVLRQDPDARAFASLPEDLPEYLTRARCALDSAQSDVPTVFMDNGAAAALGALHDPASASDGKQFVLNVGNMHALGYVIDSGRLLAVFEHHTGELQPQRLAELVDELVAGTLTNEAVFDSQGHGTLYLNDGPFDTRVTVVTGPRRSVVEPYLPNAVAAAPHGDMMISGCFGLLEGFAYRVPEAEEFVAQLRPTHAARPRAAQGS